MNATDVWSASLLRGGSLVIRAGSEVNDAALCPAFHPGYRVLWLVWQPGGVVVAHPSMVGVN